MTLVSPPHWPSVLVLTHVLGQGVWPFRATKLFRMITLGGGGVTQGEGARKFLHTKPLLAIVGGWIKVQVLRRRVKLDFRRGDGRRNGRVARGERRGYVSESASQLDSRISDHEGEEITSNE